MARTPCHGAQRSAIYGVQAQMPPTVQRDYGRWLTGLCRERGVPVYAARSLEQWEEHTYPQPLIQETLQGWLTRRMGQAPLLAIRRP